LIASRRENGVSARLPLPSALMTAILNSGGRSRPTILISV
jgi:hypothetical protein